jgi:hypothetical protein
LSGLDKILVDFIPAEDETLRSEIRNSLTLHGIRKNFLISGRLPLLCQFTRRAIKLITVIAEACRCFQIHTKCNPIN